MALLIGNVRNMRRKRSRRRNELKFFLRVQKKLQLRHKKGSKES